MSCFPITNIQKHQPSNITLDIEDVNPIEVNIPGTKIATIHGQNEPIAEEVSPIEVNIPAGV